MYITEHVHFSQETHGDDDNETVAMIKELLDTRIRYVWQPSPHCCVQ